MVAELGQGPQASHFPSLSPFCHVCHGGTVTPAEYQRGWSEILHPQHRAPGPDNDDDKDEGEEQDGRLGYRQT